MAAAPHDPVTSDYSTPAEFAAHAPSMRTYWYVFAALMAMLVITVAAAFAPLPFSFLNLLIALGIASIKAALVIYYFMHVRDSSRLTKVFVTASFLWLAIAFVLMFSDYLTRGELPMSRGWVESNQTPAVSTGSADAARD